MDTWITSYLERKKKATIKKNELKKPPQRLEADQVQLTAPINSDSK